MKKHSNARPGSLFGAVALALVASSCASTSEKDSLKEVDSLVARIERVHVESELSKGRVREAVDLLHAITAPDFVGDPVLAYGEFVDALERSEKQAEVLSDQVGPMKESADKVFSKWAEDLAVFTNPNMRARSKERLEATRARFQAIVSSVDPAVETFELFNSALRDHALFLEHDYNPAAVAAIGGEVASVTDQARRLDSNLDVCLATTLAYVQSTALPGELVTQTESQVESPESAKSTPDLPAQR